LLRRGGVLVLVLVFGERAEALDGGGEWGDMHGERGEVEHIL
jgi:hypothetical protein